VEIIARGLVVGLAVAAPVGPIGILVIRRGLADGAPIALATGLGAAVADAIFALVAGLGIAAVGTAVAEHAWALRALGAAMLVVIAVRMLVRTHDPRSAPAGAPSAFRAFAGTLALTLTSPVTIASFAAIAATLGLGDERHRSASAALGFALAVLAGSSAWWLLLAASVSRLRHRVDGARVRWIDRASALVLLAFALAAVLG
jgi:threonine/homoserine/homoserine lactone efflux protein